MQLISPDRAWSWSLVGFSVMLLISYVWARSLRDRMTAERRTSLDRVETASSAGRPHLDHDRHVSAAGCLSPRPLGP